MASDTNDDIQLTWNPDRSSLTLTFACASAANIRPEVPLVARIPLPTTAISARSDSSSRKSGSTALWIPAMTSCSFSSNSSSVNEDRHSIDS